MSDISYIWIWDLLSELGVDGENLRMADKSKGQNGDSVRRLKHTEDQWEPPHTRRNKAKAKREEQNNTSEPESWRWPFWHHRSYPYCYRHGGCHQTSRCCARRSVGTGCWTSCRSPAGEKIQRLTRVDTSLRGQRLRQNSPKSGKTPCRRGKNHWCSPGNLWPDKGNMICHMDKKKKIIKERKNNMKVGIYMREKVKMKDKIWGQLKKRANIPSCLMSARGRMMEALTMMIK